MLDGIDRSGESYSSLRPRHTYMKSFSIQTIRTLRNNMIAKSITATTITSSKILFDLDHHLLVSYI